MNIDKVTKISTIIGMSLLSVYVIIFVIDRIKIERGYCSACVSKTVDTYAEKYLSETIACIRSDKCSTEKISKIAVENQKSLEHDPCFVRCNKEQSMVDTYLKKLDEIRDLRLKGIYE